jgi:hypothetical protein
VGRRGRGRQPPVHPCLVARLPDPEGQPDRRRRGHHRTSRSLHGVCHPRVGPRRHDRDRGPPNGPRDSGRPNPGVGDPGSKDPS